MSNAVICAYARTPFTQAAKGLLTKTRADDMLAQLIKGLLSTSQLNIDDIEDVLIGCAFPEGEQGLNIARMASLLAGVPHTSGGATVNRFCGSSMEAIHMAAGKIAYGAGEVFLCGGVESMSRVPMGGFNPSPNPTLYESTPGAYLSMGLTAENLCERFEISRDAQEAFTLTSHQKASAADLSAEIIGVETKDGLVDTDGCIRRDASVEAMSGLDPAFKEGGSVTAATSSPVTDGAALTIVTSEAYADANGLKKLARIKSFAVSGIAPEIMGLGPVDASKKALARAGIEVADLDVIECNEAFAVQAMAVIAELGLDASKVNLDGGALALGHPLGATGARITGKAAQLLHDRNGKYALATQCIGGGQGIATILEAI